MGHLTIEDVFDHETHLEVFSYLTLPTWAFGWKSNAKSDQYCFWHKHFAGNTRPDHLDPEGIGKQFPCDKDLQKSAPLIFDLWRRLSAGPLCGNALMRCYANGFTYGSDGTLHRDSTTDRSVTAVYFSNIDWSPNWGGETVLFNDTKTDIVASIYPRPNRLLVFSGSIPHVARGVSRSCPVMRITLMFKMELIPV